MVILTLPAPTKEPVAWKFAGGLQARLAHFHNAKTVVAGSASLRRYLDLSPGKLALGGEAFVPNDFDIFIGTEDASIVLTEIYKFVFTWFPLNPTFDYRDLLVKPSGVHYYSAESHHVKFVLEFDLCKRTRAVGTPGPVVTKMKIIVIELDPDTPSLLAAYPAHRWAMEVMRTFDVSVCRIANADFEFPSHFTFLHRHDADDIDARKFEYTFRDFNCAKTSYRRIAKYINRGFRLAKLNFGGDHSLVQTTSNNTWTCHI